MARRTHQVISATVLSGAPTKPRSHYNCTQHGRQTPGYVKNLRPAVSQCPRAFGVASPTQTRGGLQSAFTAAYELCARKRARKQSAQCGLCAQRPYACGVCARYLRPQQALLPAGDALPHRRHHGRCCVHQLERVPQHTAALPWQPTSWQPARSHHYRGSYARPGGKFEPAHEHNP